MAMSGSNTLSQNLNAAICRLVDRVGNRKSILVLVSLLDIKFGKLAVGFDLVMPLPSGQRRQLSTSIASAYFEVGLAGRRGWHVRRWRACASMSVD